MPLLGLLLFGQLKIKMKKIKIILVAFLVFNFSIFADAKNTPESFADLAEKLITKKAINNIFIFFILILNQPNNNKANNSKN